MIVADPPTDSHGSGELELIVTAILITSLEWWNELLSITARIRLNFNVATQCVA